FDRSSALANTKPGRERRRSRTRYPALQCKGQYERDDASEPHPDMAHPDDREAVHEGDAGDQADDRAGDVHAVLPAEMREREHDPGEESKIQDGPDAALGRRTDCGDEGQSEAGEGPEVSYLAEILLPGHVREADQVGEEDERSPDDRSGYATGQRGSS